MTNIKQNIIDFFSARSDERGIPNVKNGDWIKFTEQYDKNLIRECLAEYIIENKIPFPFKLVNRNEIKKLMHKFYSKSMLDQYKNFELVEERYDYKYKYLDKPLGVIDKTHAYNNVSDFFQQENRLSCGSWSQSSPLEIWNSKEKLKKMNWHFWRQGVMESVDLDHKAFRAAFRLGTYTATQFKPTVAKSIYEKHLAKNVLDTSCGWGDRLAGFYFTKSTELYVGCDPNPNVFETYKKQCIAYEEFVTGKTPRLVEKERYFECVGSKIVKIWNLPAEDVDWSLYRDTFDLYFTSPPYFETEKYATNTDQVETQSWHRYDTFDRWKYDFFFKVTEMVWDTIRKDGFMMINIIEPSSNGKRHSLCDDMVDEFKKLEKCHYIGKIGMRMMARPNTKELKSVFIEPIWTFRKDNPNYEFNEKNTLEKFF